MYVSKENLDKLSEKTLEKFRRDELDICIVFTGDEKMKLID